MKIGKKEIAKDNKKLSIRQRINFYLHFMLFISHVKAILSFDGKKKSPLWQYFKFLFGH